MSKIVIALGGNALGKTPEEQLSLLEKVAKVIVDLVKQGNKIVLTHGNDHKLVKYYLRWSILQMARLKHLICHLLNVAV